MKKFRLKVTSLLTVLLAIFMLSGCFETGNTGVPSRIDFLFRVDAGQKPYQFDSTLVSGKDSLTIKKFRFVLGGDSLVVNDKTIAVFKDKSQWRSYSIPTRLGRNLIRLFAPARASLTYKKLIFSVAQAPESAIGIGINSDFASNNQHYSMIIEGIYNGENFTYKSTEEFSKTFSLGPVKLPQYNAHYVFIVTANAAGWFSKNPDGSGGFYNPDKANTTDHLDSLIARRIWNSLDLELHSNQPSTM